MFARRISTEWLTAKRLDTDYYNPQALAAIEQIKQVTDTLTFGTSGLVWCFGAYELCNRIQESGKPNCPGFIKISDIHPPFINFDSIMGVTEETHNLLSAAHVNPGDIIVSIAGTIGASALISDSSRKLSANQAIVKYRANPEALYNYFVAAFTLSHHFQLIVSREAGGAVQKNLYLYNFETIPIPRPNQVAQSYIGDKVRQAERLRAWAKQLKAKVDAQLNFLQLPLSEKPKMLNVVKASTLENRLDPRPYRTHYLALVAAIKAISNSKVGDIAEFASGCPVSSNDFVEGAGIPLVRIRNIGYEGFSDLDTGVSEAVFSSEPKYQAKTGQIVVGMDGIFRAQFFLEEDLPMFINQRVAILDTEGMRPELLTHWLNRPEGQMQLNQWAVKTTVEHTSLPDIARIRLPRLDDEQENQLADRLLDARVARFLSNRGGGLN